jgi:aryl-alcohol dehydrogenase-like predicted oxidoreductase
MAAGGDSGLSRSRVLRQIETSLERLGMPRVDLYLAHAPDPDVPWAETFQAFEELVARGVAGDYGVSNVGVGELEEALAAGRPVLVQNSHSLLDGDADVLELCAERGVRLQAFSPLAGGWLTGKYHRGEEAPAGSRMTMRPEPYRHLETDRVYDGLDALGRAAADRGVSMGGLALAWALRATGSVVVGPRRPAHLESVREAAGLTLTDSELEELGSLFR